MLGNLPPAFNEAMCVFQYHASDSLEGCSDATNGPFPTGLVVVYISLNQLLFYK